MTAPLPPHADDPSWELVSAYVDGVAAPDEAAAVEADPALMAQVETLRSVSGTLAAPITPAPALKEAHLGAALAEFDSLFGDTTAPVAASTPVEPSTANNTAEEAAGNVRSLDAARAKRRPRRLNMIAAAAAAVALLFAGVVAVGLNSGGDSFDTVTAASDAVESTAAIESSSADVMGDSDDAVDDSAMDDEEAMEEEEAMDDEEAMEELTAARASGIMTEDESDAMADDAMEDADAESAFAGSADSAAEESAAAESAADAAAPVPAALFLGEFDQVDALDAALQQALDGSDLQLKAVELQPELSPTTCADTIEALTGLDAPTLLGRAILNGDDVELHATSTGDVLVVNGETCTTIDTIIAS